ADDYNFDLGHSITSLRRSRKRTSRHTPSSWASRSRRPTTRKPQRRWSATLAAFSGKPPVWIVQMPDCSASATSCSRSALPIPRPCADESTYTLFSATTSYEEGSEREHT